MHQALLDNGCRVVVAPRPVGLAAVYLWIDVGSVDERPGEYGAAHYLEHLLFKGTPTRGIGQAAAEIEALGGDLNAFTTQEATVLHATVLSSGWSQALDVIVDMARSPILDPDEIARERDVILEEIRGYDAMPDELLHEAIAATAFDGHPYGRPIAGTAAEVAVLPAAALRAFHDREWGADRAILAIVGEVDPAQVFAQAAARLGDWRRASPRFDHGTPLAIAGPRVTLVPTADRKTRLAQLVWRTVPIGHPDAPALDLLALLLGDGPGSLLPERLADEELIGDPWASASHRAQGGTLSFGYIPRADGAPIVDRALQVVAELAAEGLPADAVDRARAGMISDFVFAAETVDGLAYELAAHWSSFGSPEARIDQRARYEALRTPDLDRVLRTWLRPENLTVGAHDPGLRAPPLRQAIAAGAAHRPPPVHRQVSARLDNGVRWATLPDDGEVVAVTVAIRGGLLTVPLDHAGLAEAWSGMVTAGADGMSAGRYSACVDATGGMVWAAAGRSTFELHGRFPRETAAEGLSLVLMALAAPAWDPDVWPRHQDELAHDAESALEGAGAVAQRALWRLAWPDHPWSLPPEGTKGSQRRLSLKKLEDLHERVAAADAIAIAVAGPVPTARVEHLLTEWLDDLPRKARRRKVRLSPPPTRPIQVNRSARSEQAYIALGARGLALDDPDRAALHVLVNWLSSQGGPLFLELRERLGLAYAVGADSVEAIGGGLVQVGLATDPRRARQAEQALVACVDRLLHAAPAQAEIDRTIRALHGARRTALQQAGRRAAYHARAAVWERPTDPGLLPAAWDHVTPADVVRVGQRLLGASRFTVRVNASR